MSETNSLSSVRIFGLFGSLSPSNALVWHAIIVSSSFEFFLNSLLRTSLYSFVRGLLSSGSSFAMRRFDRMHSRKMGKSIVLNSSSVSSGWSDL